MMSPLLRLKSMSQSIWIDDIRRAWLTDGTLVRLIAQDGVSGVTSNPAIFEQAIAQHDDYAEAIAVLTRSPISAAELYETLVADDIRTAADSLLAVYANSDAAEGYVSLEVSPHLAHDSTATVAEAVRL